MPRSRFHRLPTEQQDAILNAALEEFAAHSFAAASLNRIIETAGISKGSMYYYFDGKEDLYTHVIRVQLEDLLGRGGPAPELASSDADAFWVSLEAYYLHLMRMLTASPQLAGLLRGWLSGQAAPMSGQALRDAEQAITPWLEQTLTTGQAVGAIRTDLPDGLLIAVAMAIGQVIDTWLITRPPDDAELESAVHTLMSIIRRALQPDPVG